MDRQVGPGSGTGYPRSFALSGKSTDVAQMDIPHRVVGPDAGLLPVEKGRRDGPPCFSPSPEDNAHPVAGADLPFNTVEIGPVFGFSALQVPEGWPKESRRESNRTGEGSPNREEDPGER